MNNNGRKTTSKSLLILIFTVLFFSVTFNSPANYSPSVRFTKTLTSSTAAADTTKPIFSDSIRRARLPSVDTGYRNIRADTARYLTIRLRYGRSADTPDYRISKDTMDAEVSYKAADSITINMRNHQVRLFSKADVQQKDAHLTADHILLDQDRHRVVASPSQDSLGNVIGLPKMVQADNTMTSDTITYDTKSQKGITQHTYTVSGEMYVHAEKMKKITP